MSHDVATANAPAAQPVAATVVINRPLAEVYAFYHDLTNLHQFLGDVTEVVCTGSDHYHWTVIGPLGATLHWDTEVVEDNPPQRIRYRTGSAEAAFYGEWDVSFTATGDGSTQVHWGPAPDGLG